jgi:hypothetical protein
MWKNKSVTSNPVKADDWICITPMASGTGKNKWHQLRDAGEANWYNRTSGSYIAGITSKAACEDSTPSPWTPKDICVKVDGRIVKGTPDANGNRTLEKVDRATYNYYKTGAGKHLLVKEEACDAQPQPVPPSPVPNPCDPRSKCQGTSWCDENGVLVPNHPGCMGQPPVPNPAPPVPVPVPVIDNPAAENALAEIQKIEKDDKFFNLSGWTNKEGKFNWMRLGIDAAGAAVIGTTAGVLTNSLMKKSQLESGYKSLQCTYGQSGSASYGETFILR